MMIRVALLCGLLMVAAQAQADEVDDLLAGKPVRIDLDRPASAATSETPARDEALEVAAPIEGLPLVEESPWDMAIGAARPSNNFSGNSAASHRRQESVPSVPVSLVPEPSAIALAVLALLYFLIFFRRRHLA